MLGRLKLLTRAWVVARIGILDELTTTGPTEVAAQWKDGELNLFSVTPGEEVGLPRVDLTALRGGDAKKNARALRDVLAGKTSAYRDVVLLSAAAIFVVADRAPTLTDGLAPRRGNLVDEGPRPGGARQADRDLEQGRERRPGRRSQPTSARTSRCERAACTQAEIDRRARSRIAAPRFPSRAAARIERRPPRPHRRDQEAASPSRGLIREDFEPARPCPRLRRQAAPACLSILTDTPRGQGADAYLSAARDAARSPCLRKKVDLIDSRQVAESRALGADAILGDPGRHGRRPALASAR